MWMVFFQVPELLGILISVLGATLFCLRVLWGICYNLFA